MNIKSLFIAGAVLLAPFGLWLGVRWSRKLKGMVILGLNVFLLCILFVIASLITGLPVSDIWRTILFLD